MKNIWRMFWPYIVVIALWAVAAGVVAECDRSLKKENERLREELARQQQYVPLTREEFRDSLESIRQSVRPVENVKAVLTKEDKSLLKDLNAKVSAIESYQKIGIQTKATVTLGRADSTAIHSQPDSKSEDGNDTLLTYKDAWLDLEFNKKRGVLLFNCKDSLAIAVEKEYKKKFLWWRWGIKGYQVKAVSFNPYSTIRYNTYVKHKK